MNCPRCASPLEDPQARFCPTCGASVEAPAPAPQPEAAPATGPSTNGAHCAVHPERAAADICSRCGAFACRECLIIGADGTGVCSACYARQGETGPLPWEDRKERGVGMWKAYWQTVKLLMFQPNTAFDRVQPETGKWWDPLSFSMLSHLVGLSGTMVLYALIGGVAGVVALVTSKSDSAGPSVAVAVGIVLGILALFAVAVPLSAVLNVFIGSGIVHVAALLVGVKPRGFEATVRAFSYGQAPMFWGVVPVCGVYVYPIWQIVCVIFGIKGLHRTTGGKASAAVLLPVGLCCGLYAAFYAFAFFAGTLANGR